MNEILKVENLTKSYKKGAVAVDGISFSVNEGEIFALIGPNGAGKTSTIRMISTLIKPTDGNAFVDGHSIITDPDKVRSVITYLPDEAGAYKTMTGIDYLYFMAGLFSSDRDEIDKYVNRAVDMCGLGDRLEEKINGYSRGMIRKLLLSRAVMTRPRLAILDEATSGLDVINALDIRKTIKRLSREEGMSFLLSSHNMLEIEYVSDRVGIMAHGNLMAVGSIDELKDKYNAANLEEVFEKVVLTNEVG
ncbi:MAG: ABC transporter ATP-binding protein [Oscillospiraceae bacterium]|nr:ABC transporter ATP-binding protein [Oscillospiraceae bacterium]